MLAGRISQLVGVRVAPEMMFDIQVKRIHEYTCQHLNALYMISLYRRLFRHPERQTSPRCFIFGGKAAPGYWMAKLMIRLITGIAEVVNNDPVIGERMKVVFYPDFNVKNGHQIYPAADLSEQISTAGKEASGTANMKFMMNGALTIGTLDGANVEIRQQVGGDKGLFRPLLDNLLKYDPFLVLADFADYAACQERVSETWQDQRRWTQMSILNCARSGIFSSDRAIGEYCEQIWQTQKTASHP